MNLRPQIERCKKFSILQLNLIQTLPLSKYRNTQTISIYLLFTAFSLYIDSEYEESYEVSSRC